VIRRFLKLKAWRETERIAVGGGFRASRVGELVIGRADVILKAKGVDVELAAIRNDPEAAGLIGAVSLDLTPYRDEKDFALLRRPVRKERGK
jgi:hypothetical protein